jgi:hypothetical protein
MAAAYLALNRSTHGSAAMSPTASLRCQTTSVAAQRSLVLNPPAHLPPTIGACVAQYAQAALRPPELGPVSVTSARHTGYAQNPIDGESVKVTTWDGRQGRVTVAGKTLMFVRAGDLSTLDGQSYSRLVAASEIFFGLTDELQQKSVGFSHASWTRSSSGDVTWTLTTNPVVTLTNTPAQVYTVAFDKLGRPIRANACPTSCTSISAGTFETYAPLHGKVDVPAGYWASTALAGERQAAGAIADTISQSMKDGMGWNAAVAGAAAAPFAQWIPGPGPISHDAGTSEALTADRSRIMLYASQRLYTFDVWRLGQSLSVRHSPVRVVESPTSAQRQLAAETVAAQIAQLTRRLTNPRGEFVQAVIQAYAGQTAMGLSTPPPVVYANSLSILDRNTIHITLVEVGHHFGFTIRQRPDGTVVCGAVIPAD